MIIWGYKGREKEVAYGEFFCPGCEKHTTYSHIQVSRYFTLYFIPIFPMQTLGEFFRCGRCARQYRPEVLEYEPQSQAELAAQRVRDDLRNGTPLEMAHRKLVNSGSSEDDAEQVVSTATGQDSLRDCNTCNLTFLENVKRCSSCGERLEG